MDKICEAWQKLLVNGPSQKSPDKKILLEDSFCNVNNDGEIKLLLDHLFQV